jgi:hypothetical protein
MPNPSMPNIPGMGAMTDTLDFVKNLWGGMSIPGMSIPGMSIPGMSIPGMIMPTLSVDEINKQISDLKAVESWLTLNMNMLRGTIQALEVQSATISTLKSMSETLSAAVKPNPNPNPANKAADTAAATKEPVYSFSKAPEKPAEAPEAPQSEPSPQSKTAAQVDPAGATAPLANPSIWWNMLQDQFAQAVNTALASEKPAAVAASKPAAKAAAKKTPVPRQRKAPKAAGK